MTCSQGALSNLIVEPGSSPHTFDGSSEYYDFLREAIRKQGQIVGGKGIAGTRSNFAARTREGSYLIGGPLFMYTSAKDLDYWLPRVLGATEDNDVFDVAEGLPSFGILLDRRADVFRYDDCMVNRAMWRCEAGPGDGEPELVEQILEIYSLGESLATSWPGTAPSMATTSNRSPYLAADGELTIDSDTFQFHDFVILVDNHIQPRWVNSLTPTALCPQDRTVMLRATFPFTSSDDDVVQGIYTHASRHSGVSASISMTLSHVTCSTQWAFEGLQWAQVSPVVRGKEEIRLQVDFIARRTGSDSELVVTNDSVA